MNNTELLTSRKVPMRQDGYFEMSEDRKVVTPENLQGLLGYPALFRAMQDDRELRPALSPAMSTGRAMNDYLTCTAEEFGSRYLVAEGPKNPKTGKPYQADSKSYQEWAAQQAKTPVDPTEHALFANMAKAYAEHSVIASLAGYDCLQNAILKATLEGVDCLVKVDKLYVSDKAVIAVDVKTTSDLCAFRRSADSLGYREQQALISLVLEANGIEHPQVMIAAIEKSQIPRCGVFSVGKLADARHNVLAALADYADGIKSGTFRTNFEALQTI